ncbi:MAG: tail-specific protease, partial [Massilia sp.]|nr:tail-specific protease [Massilia sp.]
AKDKDFQYLREDIAEMRKLRKENAISLNEAVRRKERDSQDARAKLREARLVAQVSSDDAVIPDGKEARSKAPTPTKPTKAIGLKGSARQDDGLQADERNLTAELAAEKAAKDAKDVLLQEAAHILSDEAAMLKTDTRMASRVMPYMAPTKDASN